MIETLVVGELYSNEEIFKSLKVSNAGGIRLSLQAGTVARAAIMTSLPGLHVVGENPYHDRLEDGVLTYTAAGKLGEQTLSGTNNRLAEQKQFSFPIHGFALIANRRNKSVGPKRWKYLGLLEYLRCFADSQLDAAGKIRRVWLFEFRIHQQPSVVPLAFDAAIASEVLVSSRRLAAETPDDDEIVETGGPECPNDLEQIELVRRRLLDLAPKEFEFFVKDLLVHCGFSEVCVTKYSADGGVDVNARAARRMWIFEPMLVQVQAKRWLHSVGRKEVAELRGSLQPFARGTILTTSHFSKAAITEAGDGGKNPIGLVDGIRLSRVVLDERFCF
jgi:hypothetical protein